MVHLALLLPRLKDIATVYEKRLELGNDTLRNKNKVEDGKEVLLQVCKTISDHPEGKAV